MSRPPTVQGGLASPAPTITALIHSEDWARFDYGPQHPLRMERLGLTWRLMQAYGLTRLPGAVVHAPTPAAERDIAAFHAPEYLEVLRIANNGAQPPRGAAFGLGPGDNPVFPGLWEAAQLVAAGSLLAADLVAGGQADRVSILLVEQNAKAALEIADYGYVLETGEIVLDGAARSLLGDARVQATYLGGGH